MALCREEQEHQLLASPPYHDGDEQYLRIGEVLALNDMSTDLLIYLSRYFSFTDEQTWACLAERVSGWFHHAQMLECGCPVSHEHEPFMLLSHQGEQTTYRDWANEAMNLVNAALAA